MLGGNDRDLKDLLKQVIGENRKLNKGVSQVTVDDAWKACMGDMINKYTDRLYFNHGTAIVYLTSAPLRAELSMSKAKVLEMLNKECGSEIVKEIILR